MEAGHGQRSATLGSAVDGGLRGLQDDPAISRAQRRHEPVRVQGDLLVGMEPPAARPFHRRRLSFAVPVLPLARRPVRRVEAAVLGGFLGWGGPRGGGGGGGGGRGGGGRRGGGSE